MHFFHEVALCVTSCYMFGKSDTWRSVTASVHQRAPGKNMTTKSPKLYTMGNKAGLAESRQIQSQLVEWAEQAIAQNSKIPMMRMVIAALENSFGLLWLPRSWWVWGSSSQKPILPSPRAGETPGHSWSSSPSHCHCPTLTSYGSSSLIPASSPVSPTHHNTKIHLPYTSEKPWAG